MKVREIMRQEVITVTPETPYDVAAAILTTHKVSGMPVIDAENRLVGIISEKDLFKALFPGYDSFAATLDTVLDQEAREKNIHELRRRPVSDFMVRHVRTVSLDAPILKAGGIMVAHKIHRLPVVHKDKLMGIVSREDIFGAILRHHLKL